MMQLILAIGIGYLWVSYAHGFAAFLYYHAPQAYAVSLYNFGGLIFAGLLILPLLIIAGLAKAGPAGRRGDGLWNSAFVRRAVGMFAGTLLYAGLSAVTLTTAHMLCGGGVLVTFGAFFSAWMVRRQAKMVLGRATRPLRWLIAGRHKGMGGTARFSGLLDEWANPWEPGKVLLGRSLYDPGWLVGMEDDRHICTIATSRAGKGRSVIIPNLLTWPGSALVIDPKGQNAHVTALARGKGGEGISQSLGQTVRIIDPLGQITTPELQKLVSRFNPLAELDPSARDYAERVAAIADALVVPNSDGKESFWDNAARALIRGLIDYVMLSPKVGSHERNLATVRGLLIHPDGPPVEEMAEMGGLAQAAAAGLMAGGGNSTADVKYTAMTHTDWLDSVGMQNTLSGSDFSLKDLNNGATTIYLVLPPAEIDTHGRFLRLFVNMALQACTSGRKKEHATLFLLDEFYALGRLQLLAKAAGLMAGYGVKLWPIVQNIGQLQELYPKNWETFLGNAGIWTVFAMNDASTAKYLAERLGKRLLWRKMRGQNGYAWETAGAAQLRDPQELGKDTSRESGTLAAFTESGEAFLLGRGNYDRIFAPDRYSSDPFEPGRPGLRSGLVALTRWLRQTRREKAEGGKAEASLLLTYRPGEPVPSWWKSRRKGGKP